MVADIVFYLFATITVASALGVVSARNQVHSVLFLVLTFFTTAALFVLMGAEFLAAILVMVYMGAVAILFLFVVMMLDVEFASLRKEAAHYMPLGVAVGVVLLVELVAIITQVHFDHDAAEAVAASAPNTVEIGRVLYTKYLLPFEIASLILLVALIGAVVLTYRKRSRPKQQHIPTQLLRTKEQAVELKKVASGEGAP
ncbi:MAG: NADH-quinone oxidoreductase subunit J [Magnetococcales bacterium]|nr:NADH-quinone oxidoreductase subunit J [Magnetococcales bacterium]